MSTAQTDLVRAAAPLRLRQASAGYGQQVVFDRVTLAVQRGEIVSLLGASAVGKSTLARCLAGLHPLRTGERIVHRGARVALQSQSPVLQPWLDVTSHVRIAAQLSSSGRSVEDVLQVVGLSHRARARPHELSGGQRTRLAFARVLVQAPDVLILDEPFGGLDYWSRSELHKLLVDTVRGGAVGALLVTHDIVESLLLGDRVVMLQGAPAMLLDVAVLRGTTPRGEERLGDKDLCDALARIRQNLRGIR